MAKGNFPRSALALLLLGSLHAQDASSLRGTIINNPLAPLDKQGLGWNTTGNRGWQPFSYALQGGGSNYCAPTGASTTTYTCNLTPALASYAAGLVVAFKPDVTNTAASTLNINSLGARNIQKLSGGSLGAVASGDLVAGVVYLLRYNGTVFVLDPGSSGGTTSGVNLQTGTTYTFLNSDCGKLVSGTNASSMAYTLPQAGGSAQFISGCYIDVQNRGAGTLTITPTTSTIDGAVSFVLYATQGVTLFSDGTNYYTQRGIGDVASFVTVTHSATPTYTSPTAGPVTFYEVLTSNVTSSTLAGTLKGGQLITFTLCQDGTGGRTYTYPTNVLNFPTPDTAPSACTSKTGYYDGSNVQCIDCLSGLGGVGQYLTASKGTSAATPPSGTVRLQARTTGDTFAVMRSTGAEFPLIGMSMDMPSGFCNNALSSAVGWSIAQSGVTTVATQGSCAGTYTDILPINFSDSNDPTIIRQFILPPNWVSTNFTYIDIWVHQNQAAASGNIGWKVRIGCESSGDAFNFTYNAYTSFSTTTPTINTVLLMTSGAIATSGSSTCAAGSRASVYLQRDNTVSSNFAQTIQFIGARLYQ